MSSSKPKLKLEIKNVVKLFRDTKALDNFSIEIRNNEFVSLLGPSGCGKTTALRIVAGLEQQNSGQIIVDGLEITDTPANKRNMGMVFQQYSLFPNMKAIENIQFGLSVRGVKQSKSVTRANDLLDLVGLTGLGHRYPHQLSGGQQQRVALARAVAFEPEILLLDEPLSALDAQVRIQVREEIRRIQIELGTTTIFVTHDQEEAMAISDRVAVMNRGKLEQVDSPQKLYDQPETAFVASFVGTVNRLPGIISENKFVKVLNQKISLSKFNRHTISGDSVTVLIRPEQIKIVSPRESSAASGKIQVKSFLGPVTLLGISFANSELIHVHSPTDQVRSLNIGDEINFRLAADEVMVENA